MRLQLNGTNLSDLIAKNKDDLQTNNTTTNLDNDDNLKIENNVLKLDVLKDRTSIFNILKKKWKDVFNSEWND